MRRRPVDVALPADTFDCIEGCGFCCTFPPAVTREHAAEIESTTRRRRLAGPGPGGSLQLRVQGGCGGCVLLKDRACTAYDLRPDHCRFFPFHVYFGRRAEVYADMACPGVGAPGTPLDAAAAASLDHVDEEDVATLEAHAAGVHDEFERRAREAGVWSDPDAAVADVRARGAGIAGPEGLDELAAVLGSDGGVFLARARRVFRANDPFQWPAAVLPDGSLTWRTWRYRRGRFEAHVLHEDGRVERAHVVPGEPVEWDPDVVFDVFGPLAGRDVLVGMACDLVDANGYAMTVADAVHVAAGEVIGELATRCHLLAHEPELGDVTARWLLQSYEHDFLDRPTIGGWL